MSDLAASGISAEVVHAHLGILQSAIQRMAANSASCKTACIALVSAVLVIVADKQKPDLAWIAAIPAVLFYFLDAYYLSLEKGFRKSYDSFIDRLNAGTTNASDLYAVIPSGSPVRRLIAAHASISVWPVYLTLVGMVYATKLFLL